jgi:UDPglucose--hexose-1-phosphate uridylyltransferase
MPELRYNLTTGDWVVLSPERAKRPEAHRRERPPAAVPAHLATCPFCPGNERQTPDETARVEAGGSWLVRVVPNRFPALALQGEPVHRGSGYTRTVDGVGRHEVVVESPLHDGAMALYAPEHAAEVLRLYRARMIAFYEDPRVEHVIVFKNHGEAAGSSIEHPHSQIVGTPVLPGQVRVRLDQALRQYDELGQCLTCHCLQEELSAHSRIVEEGEAFAAFIPYAALSPFHVWIVPKFHQTYFGHIDDRQLGDLAAILRRTLRRIDLGLGNPPFNYVIRSLSPREAEARYCHWYLSIVVRVSRAAGFELGTGMFINPSLPEESARFLREVSLPGETAGR